MPGYAVQSGAAAFSQTLEDAMIAREQAKRQAMLDHLAVQKAAREVDTEANKAEQHKLDLAEQKHEFEENTRWKKAASEKEAKKLADQEAKDAAKATGAAGFVDSLPPGPQKDAYRAEQFGLKSVLPPKEPKEPALIKVVSQKNGQNVEQWVTPQEAQAMGQMKSPTQPKPVVVNTGGLPALPGQKLDPIDKMGQEAGMTPEALEMKALETALSGREPAIGRTKEGKALYTSVMNKTAQYDTETGKFHPYGEVNPHPPNIAGAGAKNKASAKSLLETQTALDGIEAFSDTAKANIASLKKIAAKVPETGLTFGNWLARATATQVGDEDVAQFNTFMNTLPSEFNRLVSQAKMSGAPLAQAEQEHMRKVLNPDAPVKAVMAALDAFVTESENRKASYKKKVKELEGRISTGASGADEPKDAAKPSSIEDLRKKYDY